MTVQLTDEEFQAIQQANGGQRLRRVRTPAGEFVLRTPTPGEESAFQSAFFGSTPGMHSAMCWRNLLVSITVHPEPAAVQKALREWPAMNMNPEVIKAMRLIRGELNDEEGK
jgi:hypothetical protein